MSEIPPGIRVRLRRGVRTMSGWTGTATMLEHGRAIKDGGGDPFRDSVGALPEQWAVMRDQTPNPEHADALAETNRNHRA